MSPSRTRMSRRSAVGSAILAPAALAAAAAAPASAAPAADIEQAFRAMFAVPADQPGRLAAARLDRLHEKARIIDHDVPFLLDPAGYADHLAFRSALFERYELLLHHVQTVQHGTTAVASAYAIERGKPRDAGFRLRSCFVTAVFTRTGNRWQALSLHVGALLGQIVDASPG